MRQRVESLQQDLSDARQKSEDDLNTQRAILTSEHQEQLDREKQHVAKLQETITDCFAVVTGLSGARLPTRVLCCPTCPLGGPKAIGD